MTKLFKIVATWELSGEYDIEADSLEEAIEKSYDMDLKDAKNVEYVDDSFKIDNEATNHFNSDGEPYQTIK